MRLRDKLGFGGGSEDELAMVSLTEDELADLRGRVNELSLEIKGKRFPAEVNRTASQKVEQIAHSAAEVTSAELPYPDPAQNPRTEDLAAALNNLAGSLVPEVVRDSVSEREVEQFQHHVDDTLALVRDAEELDHVIHEFDVITKYQKDLQADAERTDLDRDEVPPGDREDIYAGPRVREKFDKAAENPECPLWVGTGTRTGRDASIEKHHLRRHQGVFGITGHGKSTYLTNAAYQLARAGSGLCFIDPKGDDSERLMEILPEDRIDDVVWLEPGGSHEYISGFNFINVGLDPDDPNFDTALSALIEDLVALLGAGDYWGPRMDRVFRTLVRAMNEYNRRFPEKRDLNLVDLYYVLKSPESRHEFHYRIKSAGIHFVEDYLEDIAEFDDGDLEPLLGRFQQWVQDRMARRMIGFRDSDVNIQKVVEEGKILIVRMGGQPKELKRMLGMAVLRRIWSTIRSRAEMDEWERDQFYTFVDEFDNIAKTGEAIPTMLSESRSLGMGLTFCCQYPSQLPEDIVDAMMVNCDTMLSFNPGSKKQARIIGPKIGKDSQPLLDESPFHLWMRITIDETNERSDPFRVYTHPPYPPRRGREERDAEIMRSLEKYGKPEPTDSEEKRALLYNRGNGPWESGLGRDLVQAISEGEDPLIEIAKQELRQAYQDGELVTGEPNLSTSKGDEASPSQSQSLSATGAGGEDEPTDAERLAEDYQTDIFESIWAARLQAGLEPGETVPYEAAEQEIERRLGDTGYLSQLSNAIEKLPGDHVIRERNDGELHLGLTARGRGEVTHQDTGSSGSGGGEDHRWVLSQVFVAFTRLGYLTTLPEQEGEEQPDGLSKAPIDVTDVDDDLSPNEMMAAMEDRREELREEYPGVWNLAGADNVSIEAETSTFTYPFQTFRNLGKAMESGDLCVFATKDGRADHGDFGHYGRRLEQVLYDTTGPLRGGNKTIHHDRLTLMKHRDDQDRERFYTQGSHYKVDDGSKALRPRRDDQYDSTAWYRDPGTDEIVACYSKSGSIPGDGEFARFEDVDDVVDNGRTSVPAYYEYDQSDGEYVVYTAEGDKNFYPSEEELEDEWERFNKPYIPEADLPEMPSEDDFLIVIFPDDDNPQYDQPQVYEGGETTPLFEYTDVNLDMPELGETAAPTRGDNQDAEDPPEAAESTEVEEPTDGQSMDVVENRLSPGALSAKTMVDEDLCADILQGTYKPRREHREGLRKALKALRPQDASSEDLPPVFNEPWFKREEAMNSPAAPSADAADTDEVGPDSDEEDTTSADQSDSSEEPAADTGNETSPTTTESLEDSDAGPGVSLAEARAVAGEEEHTPKHRDSLDEVVDPGSTPRERHQAETDADTPEETTGSEAPSRPTEEDTIDEDQKQAAGAATEDETEEDQSGAEDSFFERYN